MSKVCMLLVLSHWGCFSQQKRQQGTVECGAFVSLSLSVIIKELAVVHTLRFPLTSVHDQCLLSSAFFVPCGKGSALALCFL